VYNAELFEGDTIRRMIRQLERVMEEVVRNAEVRIGSIRLLSEEEENEVIGRWNEGRKENGRERSIVEELVGMVEKRGDAVGVEAGEEKISYEELNRRSNQLGNYLGRMGVGEEVLVGLSMNRGIEMVVGMLGILKAGGGYVPLDVEYPVER